MCAGVYHYNTKEFIKKAKQIHSDKYDYSKVDYKNNSTKVCIICSEHGEFWQTPHDHLRGRGCPKCNETYGEKKIRLWCEKHNLIKNKDYFSQYRPNWLGLQSLDFYFPKLNIGVEYDGVQHFKPIEYFCCNKKLEYMKKLDIKKNKLCEENNIKLIRIPYTDFNKIENILEEKLSEAYSR